MSSMAKPPFAAALKGSREIGFTVLSISCSLIAVFIPLLLMSGIIGRLFREFALTVTASIAVSARGVADARADDVLALHAARSRRTHGRLYRAIEGGFNAMISFYRRTLDIVLRHQPITLGVFFATMALTLVMAIQIPKGFFPIQDTGIIHGFAEAAQQTSPDEMMRLMHKLGDVILRDPDVAELRLADRLAPAARRPPIPAAISSRSSRATSASSTPRRSSTGCGRSSPRSRAPTCSCSRRRTSMSARASPAAASSTRCRTRISTS